MDQTESEKRPSIVHRTITSAGWNILSSGVQVVVGLARTMILARLLPVRVFGIYALATSVVNLSGVGANFGMGGAFLHRAPETEDEGEAAATHFALKTIMTLLWGAALVVVAFVFTGGQTRTALLLTTVTAGVVHLTQTPYLILVRRVVHRRLALLQLLSILLTTLVSVIMALRGARLWALLSTDIVVMVINVAVLYVWRPVWRPRFSWSVERVRYFLRFGSRNVIAVGLLRALDRVDDLWTGFFLGKTPLGFYSRAYTFATYPRKVLASPINTVAGGTYAELKGNRKRLSQAFFRTNAFLVRSGFFLAGLLSLAAPEFIRLGLGEKWLPMLDAFRLMLVYTLFDPIKVTVANLFVAVGEPEKVVKARSIQLVVMMAGLFSLGFWMGITGVALAVDLMLVVGIVILLWQARVHVDFSPVRLFGVPAVGLLLGLPLAFGASLIPGIAGSDWRTGPVKTVVFALVYGGILFALERQHTLDMLSLITRHVSRRSEGKS